MHHLLVIPLYYRPRLLFLIEHPFLLLIKRVLLLILWSIKKFIFIILSATILIRTSHLLVLIKLILKLKTTLIKIIRLDVLRLVRLLVLLMIEIIGILTLIIWLISHIILLNNIRTNILNLILLNRWYVWIRWSFIIYDKIGAGNMLMSCVPASRGYPLSWLAQGPPCFTLDSWDWFRGSG